MGTKNYDSATDMITFSRASKGTALRKVSYGNELVTNGTFDTDTSGWVADSAATLSFSSGTAELVTTATGYLLPATPLTTAIGSVYTLTFSLTGASSTGHARAGTTSLGVDLLNAGWGLVDGLHTFSFTATSTTTYIALGNGGVATMYVDNVSVKEVTFDQADGTLELFNHPDDIPRIEYDAAGAVKGLLIEEARTNLLPNSSVLNFINFRTATSTSTAVSPSGLQDAVLVQPTVASGITWVYDLTVYNTGVVTTISTFAKASGKSFVTMPNSNGNVSYASFNLTTGAVGTVASGYTANIEDFGNGWYRCSVTTPTGFNDRAVYAVSDTDGGVAAAANGNDGILLYGVQLEAGGFASSYIPTSGASASRAADIASIPTSAFGYNSGAGTVVVEAQRFGTNTYPRSVMIDSGYETDSIGLGAWGLLTSLSSLIKAGNVTQASMYTGNVGTSAFKNSLAYKENDFAASRDGGAVLTDTSGVVPTGLTTLRIGRNALKEQFFNGHIKSIQYYPRRLSNAQLQELTT